MLANISPCISILFWKWLSGFEAAWSSIASDSQPGCNCPLDRAGLLLTNPVHWGRDEDALLSVPGGVWLFCWHSWWHLRRIVLCLVEFLRQCLSPSGVRGVEDVSSGVRLLHTEAQICLWFMLVLASQTRPPNLTVSGAVALTSALTVHQPQTQWAREKHERFHCLRHVLHYPIVFSPISPVLWHASAVLRGVFPCCHKFLFIPTLFNWHFKSNVLSLWSPQQFCFSYSTFLAWSNCRYYCCHLPWLQVPNCGSPGSSCSLTIISYLCICSAFGQHCQQWKKLSWLNWESQS